MATHKVNASAALANRAEITSADGETATKAVALRQHIIAMQSEFALAMPKGAEASQLVRDALTCLRTIRNLDRCEYRSVLGALMTCGQLGLRPGVLGHARSLPFWDKRDKCYKAQLIIGYQGYIELAHRSGRVASLVARPVYKNDLFDVDYGVADNLIHKPNLFEDRGDPIAYYSVVKLVNGGHAFYVMSHRDMESYRDKYAMARTRDGRIVGPWVDNFEAMALKTTIRQLAKWMPKSADLAVALSADEGVRVDLTPALDASETTEHPDVIDLGPDDVSDRELTAEEIAEHAAAMQAESEANQ